ncbi:hypothetical protein HGRIS_006781 [Hohenbuehelia grisea]|uniref:Uncharacterized protein n=1 Tax=Hohenbuehelia grisea TaxID=104357 RepID=A0ABR3JA11_9AGAR
MMQSEFETTIKSLEALLDNDKRKDQQREDLLTNQGELEAKIQVLEALADDQKRKRTKAEDDLRTSTDRLHESENARERQCASRDVEDHLDWFGALQLTQRVLRHVDGDNNDETSTAAVHEDTPGPWAQCHADLRTLHRYMKTISSRHTDAALATRFQALSSGSSSPSPRKRRRTDDASRS